VHRIRSHHAPRHIRVETVEVAAAAGVAIDGPRATLSLTPADVGSWMRESILTRARLSNSPTLIMIERLLNIAPREEFAEITRHVFEKLVRHAGARPPSLTSMPSFTFWVTREDSFNELSPVEMLFGKAYFPDDIEPCQQRMLDKPDAERYALLMAVIRMHNAEHQADSNAVPACPDFGAPKANTGLKDSTGKAVLVGDVFEWKGGNSYPLIRSVVRWEPRYGAYIHAWDYEGGGGASSINAEGFSSLRVVGNVFDDPTLAPIAKKWANGQ
jgi:hypothetical protein